MSRFITLASITLLCSPLSAWSQEPGTRIRVTQIEAFGSRRHSGTVLSAGDTLVLKLDRGGQTMVLPLAGLSKLEVSRSRKGHTGTGAALGFLAGAGLGILISAGCSSDCRHDDMRMFNIVITTGLSGALGLVAGAWIGFSIKTDEWDALPPARWRVGARPAGRNRYGLALSVRF